MTDTAAILHNATVLITGAGGSIGSELCRQVLTYHPKRLLMLGRGENSIYQIHLEMSETTTATDLVPIVADIRDRPRLRYIMDLHRPDVVLHAAANKHVPLMEANPSEAIATNVIGTSNLLETAIAADVKRFVLVSSDKAVNPTSVMGATKRIAELLVQADAASTKWAYSIVRFGNVTGSRGSVIPLFQRQIARGGPVTVTHRDATRYFMSIPDAAGLVLQAMALGTGGETFVLDMGRPVNIYALALELIECTGHDVAIRFTGLRGGEKLHEELMSVAERGRMVHSGRLSVVPADGTVNPGTMFCVMVELQSLLENGNATKADVLGALMRLNQHE